MLADMPHWSAAIANEFIRLGEELQTKFTQMQLQKLVYIAHGWNLAINGDRLTYDDPQAWDYGPVYRDLRGALKQYGSLPVTREILNCESDIGIFDDNPKEPFRAVLSDAEIQVIRRVAKDYGHFHAFKLSALTHEPNTPWSKVYRGGTGRYEEIPPELIREHFVELATRTTVRPNA